MGAVILTSEVVKSFYGGDYRVDIHDRDGEADMEPFNITPDGIQIDYQGSVDDPHSRIISSSASITMFVENNEKHLAFKDLLVNSDEGRFYIKIYSSTSPTWTGKVVADRVTWEDMEEPYTITIIAMDGLSFLKDLPYTQPPLQPVYARRTIMQHIIDIFSRLDLGDVYGSSDFAIWVKAYWYESQMPDQTANPLTYVDLSHDPFAKEKGFNLYEYKTCHEALEMIAQLFNARVYMSANMFVFEQINYRTENVNSTWIYSYTGTLLLSIPFSNEETIGPLPFPYYFKETGGLFTMLPPVRFIQLIYYFKTDSNYLHDQMDTWSYISATEKLVGLIDLDAVEDIRFLITGTLRWIFYSTMFPLPEFRYFWKARFKITLKVGDKWLKRNRASLKFEQADWEPTEWSDTFAYYYWETRVHYATLAGYFDFDMIDLNILSLIIDDEGEIRFNFEFDRMLIPDADNIYEEDYGPTEFDFRWWFQSPGLFSTLGNGDPYITTQRTYTFNGPVENSRKKYLETYIGDGPNSTNKNRIRVWNGTRWAESSSDWSPKGQTVGVSIQRLLILEMAALLVKPMVLMNGNIIHRQGGITPVPSRIFNYQGNRYLFMSGRSSLIPSDFIGSWFQMNYEPIE
jgi:hypothetical protein